MDFSPLWISLKTAFLATIITSIIGIFISYKMANYKGRGRGLIDGVFTLPIILPPTVIGFFLLLICGKNGFVGKIFMSFNKNIIFSWSATVIAATVVAFPMMYRTCRSAFEQIDKNMISAARTLGLSETKIFFKIAIPLAWPGIIGGLVLSFARALGEFGAVNALSKTRGETFTLPLEIDALYMSGTESSITAAFAVSSILVIIAVIVLVLRNIFEYRAKKKSDMV